MSAQNLFLHFARLNFLIHHIRCVRPTITLDITNQAAFSNSYHNFSSRTTTAQMLTRWIKLVTPCAKMKPHNPLLMMDQLLPQGRAAHGCWDWSGTWFCGSQDGSGAQPAPTGGAPCERRHAGVENGGTWVSRLGWHIHFMVGEMGVPLSGFLHSQVHVPVITLVFLI